MFSSKASLAAVLAASIMATPASALVLPFGGGSKLSEMTSSASKSSVATKKTFGPKAKSAAKKRKASGADMFRFGVLFREGGDFRKKRKNKRAYIPDDPAPTSPTVAPVVPTPIPASGLLLLGGLAAVGVAARRRKAAA